MITATYSLITRWFNQSATCFWPRSINLCSVKEKTRKWWVWKFSEKLYPNYRKTYSQLPLQNDVDDWGYMNKILQVMQYRCMFTSTINLAKAKRNVDRFYLYSCSNLTTTHSFRSIFAHPTTGVFYYVVKFIVIYGLLKSNVSPNRKIPKPTAWRDPCHSPL